MASERDMELLDDYLSNRLDPEGRSAFERKLENDPGLRSELELQQEFISGIKKARTAELKAMLNNVAVPSPQTGASAMATKLAIFAAVVGAVGTGLYFYFGQNETPSPARVEQPGTAPDTEQTERREEATPGDKSAVVPDEPSSAGQKPVEVPEPVKEKAAPAAQEPAQPRIDVFDPSEEASEDNSVLPDEDLGPLQSIHGSSVEVTIESANKKYNFHYQFKDGKLFLYGPFEENLYEIMEFFSEEKRTLFLYHGEKYYLLRDGNEKLRPLEAIEDTVLIRKLNEYRK